MYANCDNFEKSFEVNHWIVVEHPNYLFGKLNMANEYYINKEYHKMPDVLGKNMLLHELYPKRSVFHFNEVISFLETTIKYFAATGNFEAAEVRLEILEELDQAGDNYEYAQEVIAYHMQIAVFEKTKNGYETTTIDVIHQSQNKYTQKTKKVSFTHKEMDSLYVKGFDLELATILLLPKETLIKDLENVLIDSIERYDYYENEIDENGYVEGRYFFVIHALFLLKELKSTASLPIILDVLSQNNDYIDFFIDDFLTEDVWSVLFETSQNRLDLLTEFMLTKGLDTYAKSAVNDAVIHMYYSDMLSKKEVLNWIAHILDKYNNSSLEDNLIDSTLIGLIITDVVDIKGKELLPLIKKMYHNNYVDEGILGNYKDVKQHIKDDEVVRLKKNKTIFELYDKMNSSNNSIFSNDDYYVGENKPVVNQKKLGRNDPCYCGSGKKYKKCCINF